MSSGRHIGLSERFRSLRRSLGKTQKEAGEAVGGGLRTWQNYETGRSSPNWRVLEALTRLGVNANWLLTGVGAMYESADRTARSVSLSVEETNAPYGSPGADDYLRLPYLETGAVEENDMPFAFSRVFLQTLTANTQELCIYRTPAATDSSFVESGRVVLIDTADKELVAGHVYAMQFDEQLNLALVQKDHKHNVYLHSGNQYYREIKVPPDEVSDLHVVGRAVWTDRLL